jgi:regulation of enolase protein 1 (concanavalin A-like superfamily)
VFVLCGLAALIHIDSASGQSLPSPWSAQDIGSPAVSGSVTVSQGKFTVTAAGRDIWDQSDQFRFVYQQVTGDVDVVARVDSLAATDGWAKAGVMIRSSLAANASHGFAMASASSGLGFQYRTANGSLSTHVGKSGGPPRWLRLSRAGTVLTAYSSTDGTNWSSMGSSTIAIGATAYVGLATTSHNVSAATTAVYSQVSVIPRSLPSLQSMDIGAPAIKGSVSYLQGTYTIKAAGTDIWNTADQFYFVYQQMSGDVEVVARVRSLTNTNDWAKAGVMIRESLTAGSRHAFAAATPGAGYGFERRPDTGGFSDNTSGPSGTAPGWLRLVRKGSQIEAFQSADGTTWRSMGVDAIPMASTVYVGMAVTSHRADRATTAVLDGFKATAAGSSSNQSPLVALTTPTDGTTITAGTNLAISAAASDADGTIARVDFMRGSTLIKSDTTQPYSATWAAVPTGSYTLTAIAVDNDGAKTTSATVTINAASATNKPPTVSLTAPANGASFTAPATIAMTATASDPENRLAKVEFYSGSTLLYTDTASPFSYSWGSVAAGTYTLRAVAYDTSGASASSVANTVTVKTATTTTPPRAVVFQASADHATLVTRYELRIFASSANPLTATPLVKSDLGKPTPASNGDITVDRATVFSALAVGNYVAAVSAIGSGGTSTSTGIAFSR